METIHRQGHLHGRHTINGHEKERDKTTFLSSFRRPGKHDTEASYGILGNMEDKSGTGEWC